MSNERELFEQFATEHKMPILRVADSYSDDDTNYAWWVWQARASTTVTDDVRKDAEPSDDKLKAMRDFAMSVQLSHDYDWIDYMRDMYFIAIDKARE